MKRGLSEQAWESMRSPEEIQEDENRQRHNDGYCEGPPMCWWCQEAKEEIQEDEELRRHEEGWCNPYCSICREKRREERTKRINEIAKSKLAFLGSWEEVQEYMKRGK